MELGIDLPPIIEWFDLKTHSSNFTYDILASFLAVIPTKYEKASLGMRICSFYK